MGKIANWLALEVITITAVLAVSSRARREAKQKAKGVLDTIIPAEDFAPLERAIVCDPTPKPGTAFFRQWVIERYGQAPGAAENIARACKMGGPITSEHQEGRAWDWFPPNKATGDRLISDLLANGAELARRAGVMYFLWQRKHWRSYPFAGSPAGSFGPFSSQNPHLDHVHFSFSILGGNGETSFYVPGVAP